MSDPLKQRPHKNGLVQNVETDMKYAKLHKPKMKSIYWRYFGFPTNESDRIITKQNVVCTICLKVLTNHGNTTNLRAHLQHRHKDVFHKIITENDIKVPPRKPVKPQINKKRIIKKFKYEYSGEESLESITPASNAGDEQLYETVVPMTYDDDAVIDNNHFAKVEVRSIMSDVKNIIDDSGGELMERAKTSTSNYRVNVIEEMDPYQLQDTLVGMIVQDMRNVDSLYDPGMANFIRTLSGNIVIPQEKKIETLIRELHSDKLTTMADQIKMHSQLKPFSLGFEVWRNIEQKHFLSIYFNYTIDSNEYNLMNQLYCTCEYNKFTSIETVFEEFNLLNCTAAIVSYDYEDYLKHFLRSKNIPIIVSYDVTVDKCLQNVFALPAVAAIIEEVKEVLLRYTSEINSKEVELPILNEDFPWTQYEMLKFFAETVAWPDDVDPLVSSAKIVTDQLSTLAVTLDTLKGEEIPHSSMLSPITAKILNKKLLVSESDDNFVVSIKTVVSLELQRLVMSDDHLTISALLDPRFHRLTNINNFGNCLQILREKYVKICAADGITSASIQNDDVKPNTSSVSRRSNLELFFDIEENVQTSAYQLDANVESDLKRYRNEVYVTLDESPYAWWNKMGHMFGSLKQLATLYQCVPCVVNMNFKQPIRQQINEYQKRYMLSGGMIDAILFLHHNNKDIIN